MLNHVDAASAARLAPLLDACPGYSVRLRALLGAYGTSRSFFSVWEQSGGGLILYRFENTFTLLDTGGPDYEEAAFFLEFNPYFARLTGRLDTVERAAAHLSVPGALERANLMECPSAAPVSGPLPDANPPLRDVYDVVSCAMPSGTDFIAWYADLSHRIRHGCARAYLFRMEGKPAAACLVSAESPCAGLISGVTTLPAFTGRGLASALVRSACADLLAGERLPVLECSDRMLPFYERLGFRRAGAVAELEMRKNPGTNRTE